MKKCKFENCISNGFIELSEMPNHYLCKECKEIFTKEEIENLKKHVLDNQLITPSIREGSSTDSDWFRKIGSNDEYWFNDPMDEFPSIIAYEYSQLRKLCSEGAKYGAFLELKDVFEVILKFPAIITAAQIYGKTERDEKEKNALIDLLRKMLSLGDWHYSASKMKKYSDTLPSIKIILKDVTDIFNKQRIVSWRNNAIGHGATFLHFDDEFRKDYLKKLEVLKKHFSKQQDIYKKIVLLGRCDNNEIKLVSSEYAQSINLPSMELFANIDNQTITMDPFLVFDKNDIYFFDSYEQRKSKTHKLNYPNGKKNTYVSEKINKLFSVLDIEQDYKSFTSSALDETWKREERMVLDKIANVDDYKKATYLENEVKKWIESNDRGLLLLQMERGMGKTTFCRALDQKAINFNKIFDPNEAIVRGYYCNNTYQGKIKTFADMLPMIFNTDKDGKVLLEGNIPSLDINAKNKPTDLSDFLNTVFNLFKEKVSTNIEKLVLIIDGLDELPLNEETSIFEIIPSANELIEGVYIMMTCRTDQELNSKTFDKLNKLKTIISKENIVEYSINSQSNINLVKDYLKKEMNYLSENQISIILKKTENRFLYLRLAKEMVMSFGLDEIADIPEWQKLILYYLSRRRELYGEKYFKDLILTALIIATAYEPLTIDEIAYMFNESIPTFQLLAHLAELRGFLTIDRSTYRGALYSIDAETIREVLDEEYGELLNSHLSEMIEQQLKQLEPELFNPEDDGHSYFITYLFEYFSDRKIEIFYNDRKILPFYYNIANLIRNSGSVNYLLQRKLRWYYIAHLNYNELDFKEIFADIYLQRGNLYSHICKPIEALKDYNQSIVLLSELKDKEKISNIANLAIAYRKRGNIYASFNEHEKALINYKQSLYLFSLESNLESDSDKIIELAFTYMNKGQALGFQNKGEEALKEINRGVNIIEYLFKRRMLDDIIILVKAYFNRGNALAFLKNEDAFDELNSCINVMNSLYNNNELNDLDDLAMAHKGIGELLYELRKPESAFKEINQSIKIKEKLKGEGKLFDVHNLAELYRIRANIHSELNNDLVAIEDSNLNIEMLCELQNEGTLHSKNDLSKAYFNKGVILVGSDAKKALKYFTEGIKILEKLDKNINFNIRNDLAYYYIIKGLTLRHLDNKCEAVDNYKKGIEILELLLNENKLRDIEDLIDAYTKKAEILYSLERAEEALGDLNRIISIRENSHNEVTKQNLHYLMNAYMNRGIIHDELNNLDRAIEDISKCIEFIRFLIVEGNDDLQEQLSEAEEYLSELKSKL